MRLYFNICVYDGDIYKDLLTAIGPVFRSTEDIVSPEIKRQRTQLMAERCVSGEFGGSAYHATMSPITARMGISRGAIQRQMRRIDPSALADRTRVAAETAASVAAGHVVDIIFVERGGYSKGGGRQGHTETQR